MKKLNETQTPNTPDESTGFLLWQLTNLWQREIKKSLKDYQLTHTQFSLLASIFWLRKNSIEVTQIGLSTHSKIDTKTTSAVLKTLQKKELINRKENISDTRVKQVDLTKKGEKLIIPAIKTVGDFELAFFQSISGTKNKFDQNLKTLIKRE